MTVGQRRVFLRDVTDQHLTWVKKALDYAVEAKLENWLLDWAEGRLEVYEVHNGLVGFKGNEKEIYVEFLSGTHMWDYAEVVFEQVKGLAQGREINAFVTRPGLVKLYKKLGFRALGTSMRL